MHLAKRLLQTTAQGLLFCLFLVSCSKEPEAPLFTPSEFETSIFGKIEDMASNAEKLWPGFNQLTTDPIYLLVEDPQDHEINGFLINPLKNLPGGTIKLESNSTTMEIYQHNEGVELALAGLGQGNFFLSYGTSFGFYTLVMTSTFNDFLSQYRNQDNNYVPMILVYELFQRYQNESWTFPEHTSHVDPVQPIWTQELIATYLLLADYMAESYSASTTSQFQIYLKGYLSIKHRQLDLDQTTDQAMVRLEANSVEHIEGSARFVEHYAIRESYPAIDNDPTYGLKNAIDQAIIDENASAVSFYLQSRIYRRIGAAVIRMLKVSGVDVVNKMKAYQQPYELASELMDLSEAELSIEFNRLKEEMHWAEYLEKAQSILDLF